MIRMIHWIVAQALLCGVGVLVVGAELPRVQVGRSAAPRIDGRLDDSTWRTSAQLFPFIKMNGDGLARAQTRALVVYDDAALYVAFACDEPHMDKLVVNNTTHDGALWHDDCVEMFLRRPRNTTGFYQIIVNAAGTTYEARDEETSWNPPIRAAVHKGKDRWTAELAIPWSDLGGKPKPGDMWRANFCRERKAETELSSWSCAHGRFLIAASFGRLAFADQAVRLETFELAGQLPGANTARLALVIPDQKTADLRVTGGKTIRIEPGPTRPIEMVYPLGLTSGSVVFEASVGKETVWRAAIPVKIRPRPQLGRLDGPVGALREFAKTLPDSSPLAGPLSTAVTRAETAAAALRKAIDDSLARNKPLDEKRYRKLNAEVAVEAAKLDRVRWPVWTQNNWMDIDRRALPTGLEDLGQIELRSLVNEYESANVIITNLSATALRLRLTAGDLTWFAELPSSAKNRVSNGTFDLDGNKDGVPDGWRHVSGPRKAWRLADEPGRGRVVAVGPAGDATLTIRQHVDLDPGREYLLDFWAKSDRATPSVRVGVINSGWTNSHFARPASGTSGWHRIRRGVRPRASKLHQLVIWAPAGGGGTVWIDDVKLVEGEDPCIEFDRVAPELAVADWQELRGGSVVADPLVPLNRAGRLDIPPGESRQVWLTLRARDLPPGRYESILTAKPLATAAHQGSPAAKSVRVALDVAPLRLTTSPDFAVYNWDYARDERYVRDLFEHKVNFYLISTGLPRPEFDAKGNPLGPIDYASYDRMLRVKMRYARRAGGQVLFSYGVIRGFERWANRAKKWKFLDEAWVRAFRHVYTSWLAHLRALGLGYDDFCVQVWDEATGENVPYVVEGGKLLRQIDPKVRLVMDGAQSIEEVRRMDPVIDVWIPHLRSLQRPKAGPPLLAAYRKTGKPIFTYTCSTSMKSLSPYTYHRLKPWQAARLGLGGVFYWAYNSWRGDPWDDFDGPIADCGAIYDAVGGPITSRRWEASREGIEDWQIIRLVERLAKTHPDKAAADRARALIDEALKTVLSKKDRRDMANRYRLRLIDAAVDLARTDPLTISNVAQKLADESLTVTFNTNRRTTATVLYRVVGETVWQPVRAPQSRKHTVKIPLPPLARAETIILASDAQGRLATVRGPIPGAGE